MSGSLRQVSLVQDFRPHRISREGCTVIESYCSECGVFIAASSGPKLLELAERVHSCSSFAGNANPPEQFSCAEARVVSYLFGAGKITEKEDNFDGDITHLSTELTSREPLLTQWLERSAMNARWFRKDPIAALRAANIGIDEALLRELESVATALAAKLKRIS